MFNAFVDSEINIFEIEHICVLLSPTSSLVKRDFIINRNFSDVACRLIVVAPRPMSNLCYSDDRVSTLLQMR